MSRLDNFESSSDSEVESEKEVDDGVGVVTQASPELSLQGNPPPRKKPRKTVSRVCDFTHFHACTSIIYLLLKINRL